MFRSLRAARLRAAPTASPDLPLQPPAPDPRAVRYFSLAARYNAAAEAMGFLSLEHALRAGRLAEVIRRAQAPEHAGVVP